MKYLILIMCIVLCTACSKQDSEKPEKAARSNVSSSWAGEQTGTLKKAPVRLEEQVLSEEGMDAEKVTIMDMMDRVMKEER